MDEKSVHHKIQILRNISRDEGEEVKTMNFTRLPIKFIIAKIFVVVGVFLFY